ncbi:6632_t:CDS:2, partial [Racocetra fulgida]
EISIFIKRCFLAAKNGYNERLFCIAGLEFLEFELQYKLVNELRNFQKSETDYYLTLICCQENGIRHHILDQFSEHVRFTNGLGENTMKNMYKELCSNVFCVTSYLSGQGKTEYIKNASAEKDFIARNLLIGDDVHFDELVEKLKNLVFIEIASSNNERLLNSIPIAKCLQSVNLKWDIKNFIVSSEISSPIQIVSHYLDAYESQQLNSKDILFTGKRTVRRPMNPARCQELVQKYFLDGNEEDIKSYRFVEIFLNVFADQLVRLSLSSFFNVNNIQLMVKDTNIRTTLVKTLLNVSKDFATRSVATQQESTQLIENIDDDQLETIVQWDTSNHLVVFFLSQTPDSICALYRDRKHVPQNVKKLLMSQNIRNYQNDLPQVSQNRRNYQNEFSQLSQNIRNYQNDLSQHIRNYQNDVSQMSQNIRNYQNNFSQRSQNIRNYRNDFSQRSHNIRNSQNDFSQRSQNIRNSQNDFSQPGEQKIWELDDYNTMSESALLEKLEGIARKSMGKLELPSYALSADNLKMALILLRARANIPVVICGEAGCGKVREIPKIHLKEKEPRTSLISFLAAVVEVKFKVLSLHAGIREDQIYDFMETIHPLPDQILDYVWDYGVLKLEEEKAYIKIMVESQIGAHPIFVDLLCESQKFIRMVEESYTVSLRDERPPATHPRGISRFLPFWDYPPKDKKTLIRNSFVLSLGLCYQSRLYDQDLRKRYRECMAKVFTEHKERLNASDFQMIIRREQEDFMRRMVCPPSTADNDALLENILVMIVCILNRIPVFIIGAPGSSKSLAVRLISSNLRGAESDDEYFKTLPQAFPVQAVVLLDEVGLAETSRFNPLKVLHALLEPGFLKDDSIESPNTSVVETQSKPILDIDTEDPMEGSSSSVINKVDPSVSINKENPKDGPAVSVVALLVQRPKFGIDDLTLTAKMLLDNDKKAKNGIDTSILRQLAKAYLDYEKDQKYKNFH